MGSPIFSLTPAQGFKALFGAWRVETRGAAPNLSKRLKAGDSFKKETAAEHGESGFAA